MAKSAKNKPRLHLSVAAEENQLRIWEMAAEKDQRSLSSWVRVTLDLAADMALLKQVPLPPHLQALIDEKE